MGSSVNWISVAGPTKDEVLARFDLVDTGEVIEMLRGHWLMWAVTPEGRVILAAEHTHLLQPQPLKDLSAEGSVIAAWMDDNECTSAACAYENGERLWWVGTGEAGPDMRDLQVDGAPPPELAAIRARVVAAQAEPENEGVGFLMEGPMELAGVIGGWAPETPIGQDLVFFAAHEARTGRPIARLTSEMPAPRPRERTSEPPLSPLTLLATYAVEAAYLYFAGVDLLGRSGKEAHDWMLIGVGVCATLALGCWGKKWSLALLLVPLPYAARALNLLWALGGEETARLLAASMLIVLTIVAVRQTQPIWRP
jgi:hypothetical protein